MFARLRSFWLATKASYWLWPALFCVAALLLAFVTLWLDRAGMADTLADEQWLSPARPDGARNVLNVIAGSMIGVASTVFSITIAAVVYASGSYGPRILTHFMESKGNQLSLATFIGTFVYSVLVLRAVRDSNEAQLIAEVSSAPGAGFVPQLSLLVATLLAGVSVAVLVYFLNHIPKSIRINDVLAVIGRRLLSDIERRFAHRDGSPRDAGAAFGAPDAEARAVRAEGAGYVQVIDFARLDDIAGEEGLRIALSLRVGDFVHPAVPLAQLSGGSGEDDARIADAVRSAFALDVSRTPEQDVDFLIDELVEIGLRALSPGINDPFTAVTAMHWLSAGTSRLAALPLGCGPEAESYDPARVAVLADDFGHYLGRGFGAMRHAAASSPVAAMQFLDALEPVAAAAADAGRRGAVRAEGDRLLAQARIALAGPSLDLVEARHRRFVRAVREGKVSA